MDARQWRAALIVAWLASFGAGYRTKNFVVEAPTPQLAREIGDAAEVFRRDLAIDWLGKEMPQWGQPCMLEAEVAAHLGAGGATSFIFDKGEVFGWRMSIQGSRERILDSVLPHEVTHTIFACHFRQALPRWADEGACTTVEHVSERHKQQEMLITFLKTGRGISFSKMFRMKEYPADVMPLYSQGYSLARMLIAQGGKQRFLEFLERGMGDENWVSALNEYYGIPSMLALQNTWLDWVRQGSPEIRPGTMLAGGAANVQLASAVEPRKLAPAQAAPLVPVQRGAAPAPPAGQLAAWQAPADAAPAPPGGSVYHTPEVQALYEAPQQIQQMARPQPVQKSQPIILQGSQAAAPAAHVPPPITGAAMNDGRAWR